MIKPAEISKKANLVGVEDKQIEKDYVISWLLFGLSKNEYLNSLLAFKGGTALKKIYFQDYRFSEDLDFTLLNDDIDDAQLASEFKNMLDFITEESAIAFQVVKASHSQHDTYTFYLEYVASLGGNFNTARKVKIDISRHVVLQYSTEIQPVFLEYSDLREEYLIQCYSLPEVIIEKMAAIMSRSQPRDLYDLWHLIEARSIDLLDYWFEFEDKARNRELSPEGFTSTAYGKEKTYKKRWETSLKHQVKDLPRYEDVFREFSKHLRAIDRFTGG